MVRFSLPCGVFTSAHCSSAECLSTVDIPKLKTQVVDVLLPKVLKSMNVKQLQVTCPKASCMAGTSHVLAALVRSCRLTKQ